MFTHNTLPPIKLIRKDGTGGRKYLTPEGNSYPSVTSVLGFEPNPELDAWREKVGEEEATRIGNRAKARGTLVHAYAEDYLNNKELNISMFDIDMWRKLKLILNRINNIRLLEGKLYSDKLQVAGTTDCLADFDEVLSLIDFKTSGRLKTKEEIFSYFLQATCYACMVYERYNLKVKQIVIIIAIDDEDPQIFVENVSDYLEPLFDLINRYRAYIKNS